MTIRKLLRVIKRIKQSWRDYWSIEDDWLDNQEDKYNNVDQFGFINRGRE